MVLQQFCVVVVVCFSVVLSCPRMCRHQCDTDEMEVMSRGKNRLLSGATNPAPHERGRTQPAENLPGQRLGSRMQQSPRASVLIAWGARSES